MTRDIQYYKQELIGKQDIINSIMSKRQILLKDTFNRVFLQKKYLPASFFDRDVASVA